MGAVATDIRKHAEMANQHSQGNGLPPGKGIRKVKKTRYVLDADGYEICEDYDSDEIYDLPPIKTTSIIPPSSQKPVTKNVINLASNTAKAAPTTQGGAMT